jgi:hypothetical protein
MVPSKSVDKGSEGGTKGRKQGPKKLKVRRDTLKDLSVPGTTGRMVMGGRTGGASCAEGSTCPLCF